MIAYRRRNPALALTFLASVLLGCGNRGASPSPAGIPEFEGSVEYAVSYKLLNHDYSVQALIDQTGLSNTLFYKDGKIRTDYHGGKAVCSIYRPDENREYTLLRDSGVFVYFDCGKPGVKVRNLEFLGTNEKILHMDVSTISAEMEDGVSLTIFYAPELKVRKGHFRRFKALPFWRNTTGIYLRWETRRPEYIRTSTATAVHRKRVPDDLFEIPDTPDVPIIPLDGYLSGPQPGHS